MARTGVQYEDVRRAIDTLLQRGETPGVQKIREVLGTGSFTTISDHLREWRTQREENRDQPPLQPLPEPVESLVQALWLQAQESAAQGLAHYRQEADGLVEEAEARAEAAQRDAEDARQRETVMSEHLQQAQARLEEYSARLAKLEAQNDAAAQRETQHERRLKQAADQLQRLQNENERRTTEHQAVLARKAEEHRAQLAQEEQRHETAEARLMTLLDNARQERQAAEKQLNQRLETLEKRLAETDARLQQVRRELGEEQARHRETEWKLRQAKDQSREEALKHERLEQTLYEKETALTQLRERLRDTEARLAKAPLPPFVY
ncbi:MAG: DNA-binding protein [Halomonas sp.]|nr:DNA-binding protein [Halomonas sp.]